MPNKKPQPTLARRTYAIYRHQTTRHKQPLPYTLEDLRAMVRNILDTQECPYCLTFLTLKNFSVDHALPISRGGQWDTENLVICCRRCNETKGELTDLEFTRLLRYLNDPEQVNKTARQDIRRRLRAGGRIRRGKK